jgi:hypothetical protein
VPVSASVETEKNALLVKPEKPTKNRWEKWIESTREKTGGASNLELLQKTFEPMK